MDTEFGLYSSAKALYRAMRKHPYLGLLHLPLARAKHRQLLQQARRSDHHTYTCFYRSPPQLDAICGPVADALESSGVKHAVINVFAASTGAEAYTIASELMHRRPSLDFTMRASDLHPETVAQGKSGAYTLEEITQGADVPEDFMKRTFARDADKYVVKMNIRAKVKFEQEDLLKPDLAEKYGGADIVLAQNVLFHMPPQMAEAAFSNALKTVKSGGFLLIEGMDLDMRVELTAKHGLEPLDYKVREIYTDARRHVPENWWDYYYGSEPYSPFATERVRRYCSIFRVP